MRCGSAAWGRYAVHDAVHERGRTDSAPGARSIQLCSPNSSTGGCGAACRTHVAHRAVPVAGGSGGPQRSASETREHVRRAERLPFGSGLRTADRMVLWWGVRSWHTWASCVPHGRPARRLDGRRLGTARRAHTCLRVLARATTYLSKFYTSHHAKGKREKGSADHAFSSTSFVLSVKYAA